MGKFLDLQGLQTVIDMMTDRYGDLNELSVSVTSNNSTNINSSVSVDYDSTNYTIPLSFTIPKGHQGVAGAGGATGPQGHQGVQGQQGNRGLQGHQGPQGQQGVTGADGATGPQGHQGIQGHSPSGLQGYQGPQGHQGIVGPNARSGSQGPQGYIGHQGPKGVNGYSPLGPQGPQGHQGHQGPNARSGSQGPQGHIGHQGPKGVNGYSPLGPQGPQGHQGHQGPNARSGSQGPQGHIGHQGPKGKDSLGPQGPQGYQGIKGAAKNFTISSTSSKSYVNAYDSRTTYSSKMYSFSTVYGYNQALYAPSMSVTSDERLKVFKDDVDVDFETLKLIPKKYFTWKDNNGVIEQDSKRHLGTSAQIVQKYYPNLAGSDENGHLFVNYAGLNVVALKAIDLLYERQEELNDRMDRILSKLNK